MSPVKIAILVLNYNGLRHLRGLFDAAQFLRDEPTAVVVLVDNASYDDSVRFVREQYPWVKVVVNPSNLGWGEGYNAAIRPLVAAGEAFTHYLFLNNDVIPNRAWFERLRDAAATAGPEVGEIGCRAVFKEKFVREVICEAKPDSLSLMLLAATNHSSSTAVELGANEGRLICTQPRYTALPRFTTPYHGPFHAWYAIEIYNKTEAAIDVTVPDNYVTSVEHVSDKLQKWLLLPATDGKKNPTTINLVPHQKVIVLRVILDPSELQQCIQNSGSSINARFEGYDMHCYESVNTPQNHRDVVGACGVCKLVKREVYEELGGFDPNYFMYYEDTDFSLRLRRSGYKVKIVEAAILPHVHAGSSNAVSQFFERQVLWSLLYFHYKNAGLFRRLVTLLKFINRARMERREEDNPLSRPMELALNKLGCHLGLSYFRYLRGQ